MMTKMEESAISSCERVWNQTDVQTSVFSVPPMWEVKDSSFVTVVVDHHEDKGKSERGTYRVLIITLPWRWAITRSRLMMT